MNATTEILDIPVLLRVERDVLEGVIISALDAGIFSIGAWSISQDLRQSDVRAIEQDPGECWDAYWARNVLFGGTLSIFEPDEDGKDFLTELEEDDDPDDLERGTWHVLSRESLLAGFALAVARGHVPVEGNDDGIARFDIDGPRADIVVQLALFGELRYV